VEDEKNSHFQKVVLKFRRSFDLHFNRRSHGLAEYQKSGRSAVRVGG
jgi:hypothetical protein